ncbi:DUF4230 domain-containing protein [Zobellia uliginosa]|uniref:DUF4230 domain-containing protein n=1 Tax=Zobellia uliginosa TaxID=143224 RepID=UPI001C065FB2|nr:DUF4230 domain-containing protein [Zobellia uliginosa]MBU2947729.1 DUF4230 domain-containing protein [Zobellia uliginosa]
MDNIFDTFLGLVLGAILMYWVYSFIRQKKSKEVTKHQSTVLVDKIQSVCKLVSVEGDFAEIYRYENIKERFMSLVSSKKKALLVINAKAHIGYDLKKIKIKADDANKRIILTHFPEPEILSIEPDIQFYDIQSGMFNFFSSEDLTLLNKEAKQHIREKIPQSGLMETAKKEAIQAVLLIEKIVETIGWKLDYTALEITQKQKEMLED